MPGFVGNFTYRWELLLPQADPAARLLLAVGAFITDSAALGLQLVDGASGVFGAFSLCGAAAAAAGYDDTRITPNFLMHPEEYIAYCSS
jgi:hypothetical protein